jgi:hypothetical protein
VGSFQDYAARDLTWCTVKPRRSIAFANTVDITWILLERRWKGSVMG